MKIGAKKKKLRLQAEKLWKEFVIKQAKGLCEVCGRPANTAHHFITRSQSGMLKFNLSNGVSICNACHFAHHNKSDPYIHDMILRKRGQKWADELYEIKSQKHSSFKSIKFYQGIIEGLKYGLEK